MKSKEKMTRKEIIKMAEENIKKIFDAAKSANPIEYTSRSNGKSYKECPGAYNSRMSQAVAHDMMSVALFMYSKNASLADKIKNAAETVRNKDIQIRRMFDDMNDGRPISEYIYDQTENLVNTLIELRDSEASADPVISLYTKNIPIWIEKSAKMDIWAYYLNAHYQLRESIIKADNRWFDEDGNQIHGISEKEADIVNNIAELQKILLRELVRIPFMNPQSQNCMDEADALQMVIDSIIDEADKGGE